MDEQETRDEGDPSRHRPLRSGDIVGDYIVGDLLARGGYGTVHRARHRETARWVAVKILHDSLARMPKIVERFCLEVEVIAKLQHPNIVAVRDVGMLPDGRPYYVMDLVAGRTISTILEAEGRFSPEETLSVVQAVCSALAAAHAAGIVHRDVKSNNIMITDSTPPTVKLLDFGIAKLFASELGTSGLTTVGRPVGTLAIMAPEQIRGERVDPRVDIYAIGVLLYRMLTGRPPFSARTAQELIRLHLEEPAPRPSDRVPVSVALDAVVLRCLEKDREHRFDSVEDLVAALREAVAGPDVVRDSTPPLVVLGAAVYVELRLRAGEGEWDAELERDVGALLDAAEERLRGEGLAIVTSTSTEILGVRVMLSGSPATERAAVVDVAADMQAMLAGRAARDARLHANVAVHAGQVIVRSFDAPEVLGGALLRTEQWAPREDAVALCATKAAMDGVSGLEVSQGPGELLIVKRGPQPAAG